MAFQFTVETGAVVPGANSYVTVQEADDYIVANIHAFTPWSALDDTQKEHLLAWASRYLDQRARWDGQPVSRESGRALRWPRIGVTDRDGTCVADDEIPVQLKEAVIEMARFLISDDRSGDRGQDGLERIKVDVIELVFNTAYRLPEIPNEIKIIIQGIGTLATGTQGFGKIKRA